MSAPIRRAMIIPACVLNVRQHQSESSLSHTSAINVHLHRHWRHRISKHFPRLEDISRKGALDFHEECRPRFCTSLKRHSKKNEYYIESIYMISKVLHENTRKASAKIWFFWMVTLYSFISANSPKDCGMCFSLGTVIKEVQTLVYALTMTTIIRSQNPNIIRRGKRDV